MILPHKLIFLPNRKKVIFIVFAIKLPITDSKLISEVLYEKSWSFFRLVPDEDEHRVHFLSFGHPEMSFFALIIILCTLFLRQLILNKEGTSIIYRKRTAPRGRPIRYIYSEFYYPVFPHILPMKRFTFFRI